MNVFIREIGDKHGVLLFLSTGDEKLCGNVVLYGPEKPVADLGPKYVFFWLKFFVTYLFFSLEYVNCWKVKEQGKVTSFKLKWLGWLIGQKLNN